MSCSSLVPNIRSLRRILRAQRRTADLAAQRVEVEHAIWETAEHDREHQWLEEEERRFVDGWGGAGA